MSLRFVALLTAVLVFAALGYASSDGAAKPAPAAKARRVAAYSAVPLRFEPNRGQARKDVRYIGRAAGYKVGLEAQKITFTVPTRAHKSDAAFRDVAIPMSLVGVKSNPEITAFGDLSGKSNYLLTSDPRTWITNLPTFSGVRYRGVYPRTDLVFHGDANRLEYDFNIAPGGDPRKIAWRLDRAADVQLHDGELVIHSDGVELRFLKPVAFQERAGRKEAVSSEYRIQRDARGTLVQFAVGSYDRSRTLVIDPVLVYSTQVSALYNLSAMTTDAAGNVYLATSSGALEVAKLAPDGQTLLYNSTIGTTPASATSLAIDGSGQLYATGYASAGYATTANAFQPTSGSGSHAFVTVLNAAGSGLVYSTYLQGTSTDRGTGLALDPSGKVLISGWTYSPDFPNTNNVTVNSYQTAFVAKFDPTLSGNASLIYSALFPSSYYTGDATSVRSDSAGNAYATINSYQLNTTPGAFNYDGIYNGSGGIYVVKIDPSGATQFLAYLGYGIAYDLAVDGAGDSYITGTVASSDFPATPGAYQTSFPNAFLTKLNASGTALVFSTFLGGPSGQITPTSVAIPAGCTSNCTPYVAGFTTTSDFPTVNAIQSTFGGYSDAFIVNLTADGSAATFATYLGGSSDENPYWGSDFHIPQIGLDGSGNMYLAGDTYSTDFPFTTPGSYYSFVAKISPAAGATVIPDKRSIAFSYETMTVPSAPVTVNLRNLGSVAANISGIVSSNGAFSQTNNCGGSIPAGGSCALQVTFTPTTPGVIAGTLTISHDGTNSPASVSLSGTGQDQALLRISPYATIDFGAQPVNTASPPQTLNISNIGTQPALIYSITMAGGHPEFTSSTNCPEYLSAGASCTASVTFLPYAVGLYQSYISVSANVTVTPSYYVYVSGTGTELGNASITPSTTSINFLDQLVGTTSSGQYITFLNSGTIPVTMGPNSVTGDFKINYDGCTGNSIAPGSSCYIYVQFAPTAAGTRTGTLTVKNTAGPDLLISLSGAGSTSASALVFSPAALVFADQVIGTQSSSSSITVTNDGNAPVTISRVYDNGADFRITYDGCGVIGQYGQCTIYVVFAPTTAGSLSGTITFVDTASGSPHTVTVTGNGIAPTASVIPSPAAATFDDTVVGSNSQTLSFFLFNPGNSTVSASAPVSSLADFVVTYNGCSTIYPNSYCQLNVQFRPQSAGLKTGTITIAHSVAGSPVVINLTGTGLAPVDTLIPSPLSAGFPDTVVGVTSSYQLIYFYNPGNTNVNISNVSVSGDFVIYSNECSIAYAGGYCYVYVQFAPSAAGNRTGTLTVFDDAPGSPHTVSLSGNGVSPVTTLVPTPSSVGFDDQVVGTTSPTTYLTLYNPGNVPVTISNVSVAGDFASSGGCSTIAANSYCSLPVTFTPTAAGQRTGTLTLTDSAAGSPHGIALYGNGLAATTTVAVTPAALDFGSVVTGVSATAQLVYVTNTGTQNVTISAVSATSPYTVSGCVTTISPGSFCSMSVSVNASTTGVVSGALTITDTATGSPHTVGLAANGVSSNPAISVSPNGLTFPQTLVGVTSSAANVTFFNRSGASITVSSVATTGDFAINSNGCTSVANNGSCNVSVKFTPTANGNRSGTLVYTHNGPGGSTTINLSGYGEPSLSVVQMSATALNFPSQVVGTSSSSQTVYLWNNGTVPLTLGSSTITSSFGITSNACTSTVSPGSYCYVNVNFQPSASGTVTGALTVNASDPGSPHVVQLTGTGVASAKTLALSATALQYSDQTVGYASSAQTLTVYNTGNSPVTFTAPVITGDFAITYNGCPGTLQTGGACYVYVTFTPTASGSRTGTLTLNDNATGAPHSIALSGNGVTATKSYALTATALAFSDSPLSVQSGTQYAVLNNTGTAPLVVSGTTVTGDFVLSYNGCYGQTIAPGSACTVGVLFNPTAAGTRTGTASIGNDAPAGAAVISLTGNGVNQLHSARVSANALTFADQAVGTTAPMQYLYLYNTGNVPLTVSSVNYVGDFSNPYPTYYNCSGTIQPAGYCYLYIVFTPTTTGARTGSVTITDDSSTSPHVISLTGNGVAPSLRINVNPGSLVFPPTVTGVTSAYSLVTVTNVGNAPVQMNSATISGADFKIYYSSCDSVILSVGGYACNVYVQFQPTTTGLRTGTLTLADNATGNPHTLALSGTGVDPNNSFQLSQNSITFGNQPTNTTSGATLVYLVNQGSTPVTTTTVTPVGDFLVNGCANTTVYQSSSCAMYVYFKPTATGTRTGSVTITDNATGSPRVIALSGTGVTPFPIVTLSPNNLVFGNQNVGSTSGSQTIAVYNTGSAPLNISDVTTTTTEFTATRSCIVSPIAAGSYCQISVQFAPQATGTRTAAVQITDDASGSPHSVALSGNGVTAGPIASLSTNTLTYSSQLVNTTSAAQNVTVTNNGSTTLVFSAPAISGPFAISANACSSLAPTTSCTISMTFTPTAAGLTSGTLSISDNAPGSPHIVGLSGTGLSGPALTVTPSNLVFNSQQLNTTSATQTVNLSNSGSAVTISSVTVSAGAFAQTNSCTNIGTGSSCNISVTFTPTSAGTQTGTLTITDNAPGSPHTVALSGNGVGQPAVTLSLASLDFGSQNVGTTSATQTVNMSNTGAGPLAIASIAATGDYTVTNNCGNNLIVGASCTLTISFHPTGANTRAGAVNITDNAPGSPQSIALTGVGDGAVASLSLSSLTFGSQTVGTTTTAQTVTLTNTGNVILNITSIASTNPQFAQTNNCSSTLAADTSCTISVTFSPTATGSQDGYITVATGVSTQNVSLSGSGTGPFGSVTPTSLSFGSVGLGTPSATQTVTFSSTGTTALTISGISISGDFSQTNNCPASLAFGSNCTIQVTFTPTAAGSRSGSLFIKDNGSLSGHSVSLIGTGLGPLLTLNPSALSFGTVTINTTTSPQSITVTNSGTVTLTGLLIGATTGDFAQSNNCPTSLAINATCNINVTFAPTLAGSRSGSLTVTSSAAAQTATFSGAGSGPLVQLNPASLNFGNVVQSTTSPAQTVTLTNSGNANLNISSIAANGDFAQTNNCPAALGVSSLCTISVTFTPSTLGAQTGAVTIVDDAGGSPHLIGVSGNGIVPQTDLALTGVASPASIPPGGNATYSFTITNNGPSVATSVSFTASLPTNALVTSATASSGSCTTGSSITCTLSNMAINSTATVTVAATATGNGVLSTTASVSAAESDPNVSNNQVTVSATVAVADLVVTTSAQSGSSPTYLVSLLNSGPSAASNVSMACSYDRFGYVGVTASQGSCSYSGQTLSCSLGYLASSATANVSLQVQPPATGWATIACHAQALEFDPNPVNNSAQITPDGATNTNAGDNVGVQLFDGKSGTAARVVFPSVKQSGATTMSSVAGATPPAGFRNGSAAWTYDVSTTATIVGSPLLTFAVAPTHFHHPANVRLFHMESGAWVDRTIAADPATNTVAAIAGSLSPFALFEPVNHLPVASAGLDRVVAGTSVLGSTVVLDGSASADVDGDALSYRWSGPFAEGNGAVSGARPSVTLPFGTSKLTLVANDGEADSPPVTINVTVTDFGVAVGNSSASLVRGQSTSIPITVAAVGGTFDQPVTLGCANLPAGMNCQFSPASVTPGQAGTNSTLTITTTVACSRPRGPLFAFWLAIMLGPVGLLWTGRNRRAALLLLLMVIVIAAVGVGCGGGGTAPVTSNATTTTPAQAVTITVTGTSSGLQHSATTTLTLK